MNHQSRNPSGAIVAETIDRAANRFWAAWQQCLELPFMHGAKVTESFRQQYCEYSDEYLAHVGLRFEDLPRDSLDAVRQAVMHREGNPMSQSQQLYNLYAHFINERVEAGEPFPFPAGREEINHLHDLIVGSMNAMPPDQRFQTALDLACTDQWNEEFLKIYGEENGEKVLKSLVLRITIPECQRIVDEFTADCTKCRFTGEAEAMRQNIVREMNAQLKQLKSAASANLEQGRVLQ